jgi:group I intron endonuclease
VQESNEKKHNYFYKITNLINGKYYYGIHSTDNLNDGYKGNGTLLKLAKKKYGIKNFIKEIIADYPTRKEASEHEKMVVTMDLVLDENCYNMKLGGLNENTYKHTDETKNKLRVSRIGKNLSKDTLDKISGENHHSFGKVISPDTKLKMSLAKRGEKNHNFGKPKTDETKKKISDANTGRTVSNDTLEKMKIRSTCKPCIILGIYYISVKEASRQLNIFNATITCRIKSKTSKWVEWQYASAQNN